MKWSFSEIRIRFALVSPVGHIDSILKNLVKQQTKNKIHLMEPDGFLLSALGMGK